jgi:hypothetical protein
VDIDRNALCPCDSGKKVKRCCLDEHVAWERDGKGIMDTYVELPDGSRCPVAEWEGTLDAKTRLVSELNPVTSAWVRNTLPNVERFGHPGYRGLLLEHLVGLSGGTLALSMAVDLVDELTAARDYMTFELTGTAAAALAV